MLYSPIGAWKRDGIVGGGANANKPHSWRSCSPCGTEKGNRKGQRSPPPLTKISQLAAGHKDLCGGSYNSSRFFSVKTFKAQCSVRCYRELSTEPNLFIAMKWIETLLVFESAISRLEFCGIYLRADHLWMYSLISFSPLSLISVSIYLPLTSDASPSSSLLYQKTKWMKPSGCFAVGFLTWLFYILWYPHHYYAQIFIQIVFDLNTCFETIFSI